MLPLAEDFFNDVAQKLNTLHILDCASAGQKYASTSLGSPNKILLGALFPKNTQEVVIIVQLASRYNVPLYPISTGKNWGYGGAWPNRDDVCIVDLSLMNDVSYFNEELGLITVQPGVTFKQASLFLRKHKSKFLCPTTGAGPETSLVGNSLERGIGSSHYLDRYQSIMAVQAVLADGSVYESNTDTKDLFRHKHFYKWGIGPYLDSLFGQSNFGIVTQLTFALCPRPARSEAFCLEIKETESLKNVIDETRAFLFKNKNSSVIRIHNTKRLMPVVKDPPRTYSKWLLIGINQGAKETVNATRSIARQTYSHLARKRFNFYSTETLRFLSRIHKLFPYVHLAIPYFKNIKSAMNLANGNVLPKTPKIHLDLEKKDSVNTDDLRAGLLFFYVVAPMIGEVVLTFLNECERICSKHGFSAPIAMHNISERSLLISLRIIFDKQNEPQRKKAMDCYTELRSVSGKTGVMLSRSHADFMEDIIDARRPFWKLALKVKDALDPKNIISPGRYGP